LGGLAAPDARSSRLEAGASRIRRLAAPLLPRMAALLGAPVEAVAAAVLAYSYVAAACKDESMVDDISRSHETQRQAVNNLAAGLRAIVAGEPADEALAEARECNAASVEELVGRIVAVALPALPLTVEQREALAEPLADGLRRAAAVFADELFGRGVELDDAHAVARFALDVWREMVEQQVAAGELPYPSLNPLEGP
jgi:hypothetical protein